MPAAIFSVLLLPSTAAAPGGPQATIKPPTCAKHYSRATFHRTARRSFRRAPYTRHERRTLRRVVRCQYLARSKPIVRLHLKRYRRAYRVRHMGPRGYARWLLRNQPGQFACLDQLVMRESGWNPRARNPSSGAYGIPQSLPASKMATHGADWETNPRTQIRWMLSYIRGRYGTPCGALAFHNGHNSY